MWPAFTGSAMQLMIHMGISKEDDDVKLMLFRLWPYLRHPVTSVRLSAVRLFAKIVAIHSSEGDQWKADVLMLLLWLCHYSV
jgi:hypothetical protein